mgnify:CR=1 FL=1
MDNLTDPAADPILDLIPPGYRGIAIVMFVGIPYLTRAYHALSNNGGLKGVWNAIMFGTNGPKILIASLALLTLTSCSALTTFVASPAGQATTAVAVQMGKKLAEDGEIVILRKSIDSLIAERTRQQLKPAPSGIAEQIMLAAKVDGISAAIAGLQHQYRGLTGHDHPIGYVDKQDVCVLLVR